MSSKLELCKKGRVVMDGISPATANTNFIYLPDMIKQKKLDQRLFILVVLMIATVLCCVYGIKPNDSLNDDASSDDFEAAPAAVGPACIQWNGILYIYCGQKVSDVTDIAVIGSVLGKVTSVLDITEVPLEDGQANSSLLKDASFAECDDCLAVSVENEWLLLLPWHDMRELILTDLEVLRWDGKLYRYFGEKVGDPTTIGPIINTAGSVVESSKIPTWDRQANSRRFKEASFAECDDGLAVLVENEWLLLVPWLDTTEGIRS